jgi:hypothetical protein
VAHAYNPSYSGGSDQEDHGSKPAWANSLPDPVSKKKKHKKKRAGGMSQGICSEFKPQYWAGRGVGRAKKKERKKRKEISILGRNILQASVTLKSVDVRSK